MSHRKVTVEEYYDFGYSTFGPFLYGFVSWLNIELNKYGIKKIFFFARDGYMMQKAFDLLNKDNTLISRYVYFSRSSLRVGLLYNCKTYKEALKYLTWARYISIHEILDYFGFNNDEVESIVSKYELDISEYIQFGEIEENKKLEKIYNDYKGKIDKRSEETFKNIVMYIKQNQFDGRCAIVDIGWHGNMQWYLEEILSKCGIRAEIYGFYVGITALEAIKDRVDGFLYSNINKKLRKSVLCFFGGYEKLFQSLEGSTKGYVYVNGYVEPVLKEYEYEFDNNLKEYIRAWQQGALDYIASNSGFETNQNNCIEKALDLVRFGEKPDLKRLSLFYFLYNVDGEKIFYLPQKSIFKYKPKEFIHSLSNSVWKTGFMRAAFKLPLPYNLIYNLLRK